MFANGMPVLFVDGYVLNAGLLVGLSWVGASGLLDFVLPWSMAQGFYFTIFLLFLFPHINESEMMI